MSQVIQGEECYTMEASVKFGAFLKGTSSP